MAVLPMDLALTPEDARRSMAPELAVSLVALLETARRSLGDDHEAARASIARASSLLRVAIDGGAEGAVRSGTPGVLAGWQVSRVKAYIDDHLDRPIHIKDLATVAQRSTAYFCRAFKRTFGETPHAFIIDRRLARASHLMLTSDLSLSEIALSCGFTDQAHLCKLFRQKHAESPAVWRRERCALVTDPSQKLLPMPLAIRSERAKAVA